MSIFVLFASFALLAIAGPAGVLGRTSSGDSSSQWIIVNLPEQDSRFLEKVKGGFLAFLDDLENWTVVIVGPVAHLHHGCSKCLVLAPTSFDNEVKPILQNAFITAIDGGAESIYVMTSLHDVKVSLLRMISPNSYKGLTYSGETIFNACSYFAQPLLGMNRTFGECSERNWIYSYSSEDFTSAYVTGMCEDCGKVSDLLPGGRVHCDPATPAVMVQPGTFAKSVFGNSLWRRESFWALFFYLLQADVTSDDAEDLRMSYFTQRLLWEVRGSVSFIRSHGLTLERSKTSDSLAQEHGTLDGSISNMSKSEILKRFCAQSQGDIKFNQFMNYLRGWSCSRENGILECVRELSKEFWMSKLLSERQLDIIDEFLSDLVTTKYVFSTRTGERIPSISSYVGHKVNSIYFWSSPQYRIWSEHPFHKTCSKLQSSSRSRNKAQSFSGHSKNYGDDNKEYEADGKMKEILVPGVNYLRAPQISDVVLIIIFKINDAATQIQMAQYFDFMYGRHFKHVVYCASGRQMVYLFAKMYPQPMNYIDLKIADSRLFPYLCVSETMRMYQDVTGYLQLNSDTLLNPWKFSELIGNLSTPWMSKYVREAQLYEQEVTSPLGTGVRWYEWNDPSSGQIRLNATLHDLGSTFKAIQAHLEKRGAKATKSAGGNKLNYLQKYYSVVKEFLKHFETETPEKMTIRYGSTAIFYVPRKYRENFILLSDQFFRFNVHADIAVPTILYSFTENDDVERINGTCAWTTHTSLLLTSYNPDNVFLSPWQLYMMGSADRLKFMCQTYLPRIDESLLSLPPDTD